VYLLVGGYALNRRYVMWTAENLYASSENQLIILRFSA